ncbi:PREDICTED: RNA-binding protein 26 [Ceratosolen solmsi marchali]|uniref:RNA-binding protein 26 n=1 Tax=Ceratosolen solmsi marchali TaxID=326594 RepID=A0AAJ6YKD2_9HYME|nr:PREDICTED: RNA-binding protein 26 [Ceratosolen solmsi marchali]
MLIENPEQFKAWLTAVLEPLCDADPAALAKYVYALVKKDKTLDELRIGMVEQLDVFLQQETQNFVELLFKTLETQEYILPVIKEEDGSRTPPTAITPQVLLPSVIEPNSAAPLNTVNTTPIVHINGSAPPLVVKRETRKSESEKEEKDREKRPRSRGRARSRTRSRSRSWDRDRRRSRSREHRRDRERDRSRPWRNKSPPLNIRRHDRRRSRSRSSSPLRTRTRDGPETRSEHRSRFRNRSPTPIRSRSRSRSIERKKLDRLERVDLGRLDRMQESAASPGGGTPTQDSNHGDVDMRLSTTSQSIQSGVTVASSLPVSTKRRCRDFDEKGYCMRGDLCPYDHGTDPVVLEDVPLSRVLTFGPHGAQAPGAVPVVAVPEVPPPGGAGPNGNAPPPHLPIASLPPPHLRNQHHANMDVLTEYNPDAPSMEPQVPWGRHQPPPGPAVMYGRGQRELISVPVAPHTNNTDLPMQQQPPQQQHHHHHHPHHQPHQQQQQQQQQLQQLQQQPPLVQPKHPPTNPLKRKQAFDFNRLGPKQRTIYNPSNCSLELKKVPRILNNISQLNNHFSKFGKIVNIQVNIGGDPEAALVTFELPIEAKRAFRCTEAVLNNRFIRVFWHKNVNNNAAAGAIENVPPVVGQRPSVKDRLGAAIVPTPGKIDDNEYVPTRRLTEDQQQQQSQQQPQQQQQPSPQQQSQQPQQPQTPQPQASQSLVTAAAKAVAPATTREDKVLAIKKTQEILAAKETLKKKQEEKRKEALKLTADLRKRKQELLDKQLTELRSLIERAEKNPDQKDAIMVTIKVMQQSIDSLRKDLAQSNNGQSTNATNKPLPKTREQAQREILDAELDLMTAQQEGQDSAELQKKLLELRAHAAAMELNTTSTGRGSRPTRPPRTTTHTFRGRGRGGSFTHVSVDHRPTNLLVSGYETEEKTEVLAHFQQFGEIVNQIVDDATPSIVINYKSRKEAELAMSKGRNFQDRVLSITWVSGHHLLHRVGGSNSSTGTNLTSSASTQRSEQLQSMTDEEIDLENVADVETLILDEGEEEEDEDGEPRSWRR